MIYGFVAMQGHWSKYFGIIMEEWEHIFNIVLRTNSMLKINLNNPN